MENMDYMLRPCGCDIVCMKMNQFFLSILVVVTMKSMMRNRRLVILAQTTVVGKLFWKLK